MICLNSIAESAAILISKTIWSRFFDFAFYMRSLPLTLAVIRSHNTRSPMAFSIEANGFSLSDSARFNDPVSSNKCTARVQKIVFSRLHLPGTDQRDTLSPSSRNIQYHL